jgi:hypothetical protein
MVILIGQLHVVIHSRRQDHIAFIRSSLCQILCRASRRESPVAMSASCSAFCCLAISPILLRAADGKRSLRLPTLAVCGASPRNEADHAVACKELNVGKSRHQVRKHHIELPPYIMKVFGGCAGHLIEGRHRSSPSGASADGCDGGGAEAARSSQEITTPHSGASR